METIDTTAQAIEDIRRQWGQRLLILGHLYQRTEVLRHADATGDSLELSRTAASRPAAERIVFCGVRFMAESADILSGPQQAVYMPDTTAGCPMANMADVPSVERAWDLLRRSGKEWIPIVYVNSSAGVKALCGRWGGSTCTSSNASRVVKWALNQGARVFFLPDEHLGWNTAHDMSLPDTAVRVYDPHRQHGGLDESDLLGARIVVWKGFCLVHQAFTVEHVQAVRARWPGARIIVHPETPRQVLRLCDAHGSTSQIIRYVDQAEPGSTIIIGTELNLVQRLAEQYQGRLTIKALHASLCANMAKTNEINLLRLLRDWPEANRIVVPAEDVAGAHRALERMLSL